MEKASTMNLIIVIGIMTMNIGCGEETPLQDCEGENAQLVETFYNDEFGSIPCSLQDIDPDKKLVNLVIKSQADYEKYFICSDQLPDIEFENFFLLAGRYRHNNCAVFDSQQVIFCNSKIIYKVEMLEQACQAFTNVFYVAAIKREYENLPVEFNIKFVN